MKSIYIVKMFYPNGILPLALEGLVQRDFESYQETESFFTLVGEPIPFTEPQYDAMELLITDAHSNYLFAIGDFYNNFPTNTMIGAYANDDDTVARDFAVRREISHELLAYQDVEGFAEHFTRNGQYGVSTLNPADFEYLTAPDIAVLLSNANIGDLESLLKFGKYFVTQFLGYTQEEIDVDFQHAIDIQYPKDYSGEYHSYRFTQNVIFDNTITPVDIDTPFAVSFLPSYIPLSPAGNINGSGEYVFERRGVYNIQLDLTIAASSTPNFLRRINIYLVINGVDTLVHSIFYPEQTTQPIQIQTTFNLPVDRNATLGLSLISENVENGVPAATDMELVTGNVYISK